MNARTAACAALLALAALTAGCGSDSPDREPAAKPKATPSVDRDGAFITAAQDAELEFTGRHPANDELLAFPPKWCAELADGHSVAYMFDMQGPDLYPYAVDWGLKKDDANDLLVIGVKGFCPEHLDTVTEELRDAGEY